MDWAMKLLDGVFLEETKISIPPFLAVTNASTPTATRN